MIQISHNFVVVNTKNKKPDVKRLEDIDMEDTHLLPFRNIYPQIGNDTDGDDIDSFPHIYPFLFVVTYSHKLPLIIVGVYLLLLICEGHRSDVTWHHAIFGD